MNLIVRKASLALCFILLLSNYSFSQQPEKYCGKKLVGYVPNWTPPTQLDYASLTHAAFAFLNCSADGNLVEYTYEQESIFRDFLKQTKKHNCKRLISLAGGADVIFPQMAANPEARKVFIQQLLAFCAEHKLDGIDMDWEAMDNAEKKKNYTLLMKEIRTAIKGTNLVFVATIGFGNYWCQWIENEALQQADWIQLMIYDQTGTWATSPFGNHSSFDHVLQAETYWTERGFSRDKIVLGVPFYGYRFANREGGQGTSQRYADIVQQFPTLQPSDDQTPGEDLCFFNGPETIKKKTQYALDKNFGGIMIWEISQDLMDDKALLKTIAQTMALPCTK